MPPPAAAAPAAAPAAALQSADIKIPFDHKTHECVADVRALARLPADPDDEGVAFFRAFLLPKGHTVHVPGEPGCYACYGRATLKLSLCLVHFVESTKRKDELLLAFVDYAMLSNTMSGMYVMSLHLPLMKARNVYEDTPRYTSMKDVAGFSPIDAHAQPWCAMLQPALEKQPIFKEHGVYKAGDVYTYMKGPLSTRLQKLQAMATADIGTLVSDLARQDKRAAERAKAKFTGRLEATMKFFKNLDPEKYGRADRDRLIKLSDDTTGVQWLKTPVRDTMKKGEAKLVSTSLRASLSAQFAEADGPEPVETGAEAEEEEPDDEPDDDEDADSGETPAADAAVDKEKTANVTSPRLRSKRARTLPARLESAPPQKQPKKDTKDKGKAGKAEKVLRCP